MNDVYETPGPDGDAPAGGVAPVPVESVPVESVPVEPPDPSTPSTDRAPSLALLAALAAVTDLAISRIALRLGDPGGDPHVPLALARAGLLPRNVVAVAGLVALATGVSDLVRRRTFARLHVRFGIAVFAGILLPSLIHATVLPRYRVAPHVVLFGMFAGAVLSLLVSSGALRARVAWTRPAAFFACGTAFLSLVGMAIASLRVVWSSGVGGPVSRLARQGSELCWWLAPTTLGLALCFVPSVRMRMREALPFAATLLGGVALAIAAEGALHPHYATIVYGAFRVSALPEALSWVYTGLAGFALASGVGALVSADACRRQLGAALLLWTAGGHAPRSPVQIIEATLAFVLLARVVHAEADRRASRRGREIGTVIDAG